MKTINVTFDDEEYRKLEQKKGKLTWRQFILKLVGDSNDG
jgi:predicted CopG family antitoxin